MKETQNYKIEQKSKDPTVNIALDTINIGKQALIFVNTRPSAEKTAEEISKKIKHPFEPEKLEKLSYDILNALSSPTKQCRRLAEITKKGVAFHHSGLSSKQRELVEEGFKTGLIKVISATPTLAAGLSLPAFRSIIRDLKRYGPRGMQPIQVLEFEQMAGRAGRPEYDKWGEAICIANSEGEKDAINNEYLNGEIENIYSKLAVEPVLRTYLLSLISTEIVRTEKQILDFFSETFWAKQFRDMELLRGKILDMLDQLEEWGFITILRDLDNKQNNEVNKGSDDIDCDFISADKIGNIKKVGNKKEKTGKEEKKIAYKSTEIGKRTAELYLDPLTAHDFLVGLRKTSGKKIGAFGLLQLVCNTLELRPLLRVGIREYDKINEAFLPYQMEIIGNEPTIYEIEYDTFMDSVKTALMLNEWINEKTEDYLLEEYKIRPGELRAKIERGDWLLYACSEYSRMLNLKEAMREIKKLRIRIKNGVREELLGLLQLKDVGRVRARKMYQNGIKDLKDVKNTDFGILSQLLGKGIAENIKKQVGEEVDAEKLKISETKRKGQMSLGKY